MVFNQTKGLIGAVMTEPEIIFERIVGVAAKAGKTPSQLAIECGVSPQRLFNWRRRGVPPLQVKALSAALGLVMLPHELRPDLPDLFPAPKATKAAA
ncbi:YdaS family helix-turn-helix protein [Pseudomonas tohonis]|uniref:YdaS family helix-turn-helix protein n=1 Tax=Pseudomonas tohonis TaxID=2725477 RepID=UPI001F319478|nr:YdaS family helix-turn-helix protein [Pseudomonas tohonis]